MTQVHRRHDISDKVWVLLEPHLPGREGSWGGIARDNRQFIDAVFWIIRARVRRGVTYLRIMEIGVTLTVVLSVGVIREYGEDYWKF